MRSICHGLSGWHSLLNLELGSVDNCGTCVIYVLCGRSTGQHNIEWCICHLCILLCGWIFSHCQLSRGGDQHHLVHRSAHHHVLCCYSDRLPSRDTLLDHEFSCLNNHSPRICHIKGRRSVRDSQLILGAVDHKHNFQHNNLYRHFLCSNHHRLPCPNRLGDHRDHCGHHNCVPCNCGRIRINFDELLFSR